jgi:hypothetical protein
MSAWRRGAAASAIWLAAFGIAASAAPPPDTAASQQSADEYYDFGDQRVTLRRSPSELVVHFTSGDREEHQRRLSALTPPLTILREIRNSGRLFYLTTLARPAPKGLEGLVTQLAGEPGFGFIGPVYLDAVSHARMIPTDEIIVRLKPGVSRTQFERLASAHSVAIAGTLPGTSEEYVLRLTGTRGDSTLQLARELRGSGLFSWVQPDFLRELQKEPLENSADVAHVVGGAGLWLDIDRGRS